MQKIELIICHENGSWQSGIFVEVPEHLVGNVDLVADYCSTNLIDDISEAPAVPDIVYIGVLNWEID